MKITFEISQSINDLLEYCQTNKYYDFEMAKDENEIPYRNKARLIDIQFDNSYAEIIWKDNYMLIYTAWSGFKYEIFKKNNRTYCTYDGAVKGLLNQNLIPHITPIEDIYECVCHSSTHGWTNLRQYLDARGMNLKLNIY
jgi:hypothetical protein